MEVHETSWPTLDHDAMTAATRGDCATEHSQTSQQRHGSASHDQQNFADFFRFYPQSAYDPATSSDSISFGLMGVDDSNMPTQFGAMNDFQEHSDPSSLSSSLASEQHPNGLPHGYPTWPIMGYEQVPPFQPGPWMNEHQFHQQPQPQHPFDHAPPLAFGREGLGIHMPPTSHPIDTQHAMHFGGPFIDHDSPITHHHHEDYKHAHLPPAPPPPPSMHDDLFANDDGQDDREASADPPDVCYAQLLYNCLREAPDNTLSLRELYDWVQQHSQKAKDPKNRGWQNSVRHNLSMNAAFARVPNNPTSSHSSSTLPKKGSLWRLTPEALRSGVISTTRYRKDPKRKPDSSRRAPPALNRQTSGAKGGRATRDATRLRRERERQARGMGTRFSPYRSASPPGSGVVTPSSPYFMAGGGLEMMPTSAPRTPVEWEGGYSHLKGPPHQPLPEYDVPNTAMGFGGMGGGTFDFLPLDLNTGGGLFGNVDPEGELRTPTPSLVTEGSWAEDGSALQPPSSVVGEGEFKY